MFYPKRRNVLSECFPSMAMDYILTGYKEMKKLLPGSCDRRNVWILMSNGNRESFGLFI